MKQFDVQFGEFLSDETDYETALTHLKRSIAAICRDGRGVTFYYIGKGSGPDATFAMDRRYDDTKSWHELTEVWALYRARSRQRVKDLEAAVNEYFMRTDPSRCVNEGKGSAGRKSAQPWNYIYLALRRH